MPSEHSISAWHTVGAQKYEEEGHKKRRKTNERKGRKREGNKEKGEKRGISYYRPMMDASWHSFHQKSVLSHTPNMAHISVAY